MILPQVLQYAIWADTNPDSIKALWLEAKDRPEDLEVPWEDLRVRIIIIAPIILPSTLQFVDKISYDVDLIEINRWVEKTNQLILVKKLELEAPSTKVRPVKGLPIYDEEYYKTYRNKESVKYFFRYIREVENIIKHNKWSLDTKLSKHYCGFKAGYFMAFRIAWIGSKTFAIAIRLKKSEANKFKPKITRYIDRRGEALYYIEPNKTKTQDFKPIFEIAYKRLTGD